MVSTRWVHNISTQHVRFFFFPQVCTQKYLGNFLMRLWIIFGGKEKK